MIEKELFELLQQQYSPIISDIINSDVEFYRTNQTIRWKFGYDERVAIFAWCNRKTNIVTVNIAAVDFALQQNEPLDIEYFLLHEIRHIYQHLEIEDYRNDSTKCNNAELAKKWSEEEDNYVTALNKEGKENTDYFLQDMEMDAFAYAYAVMKYPGVRYDLMHLFALAEDKEKAEELFKAYDEEQTSQMMLPLCFLYYKIGETETAENLLLKIKEINKVLLKFIKKVLPLFLP